MKLTEIITLLKAGYTKDEIAELAKEKEEPEKEEQKEDPEKEEQKEEPEKKEQKEEEKEEPDYKALYEEEKKKREAAQAQNVNKDTGDKGKADPESEVIELLNDLL